MRRQSFGEAFNPYIQNTANIFTQSILNDKELERQEAEKIKAEREQSSILGQLMGEMKKKVQPSTNPNNQTTETDGLNFTGDISPERSLRMLSRLTPNNYNIYKDWMKMKTPKEDEYLAPIMDKSSPTILQWNKSTRKLDDTGQPNPLYEPEQATTFEYKKANEFEGLEDYPSDYKVRITKKGDKITEQTIPFSPTQQKINIITNQPYNQLSDYSRKTLQDYVAEADRYTRILSQKPNKDNLYEIYDKWGQLEREVTREEVEIAKKNALDGMASFVNENLGEGVSDYNALKSTLGTNPKSLWTSIYNAYVKDLSDKKDDAWFETAKYKFYIDFGYDPIGRYGLGGTTKTGKK